MIFLSRLQRIDRVNIDVDKLTEEELIDLNNRISARLRLLNQMRAHKRMMEFKIGDRVTFQPGGRPVLTGILTRYNQKTVTVITDGGEHWNVSPDLLRKAGKSEETSSGDRNVIPLHRK
jgi:hypothetical protein